MSSPATPVADREFDLSDEDMNDLVPPDLEPAAPAAPAPSDTQAEPPPSAEASPPTPAAPLGREAVPGAAPTTPETPVPWTPPSAGEPFAFKVDGREHPLEGALRLPDGGVYLPPGVWDQKLRPFLADRSVWVGKERNYQQAIARAKQDRGAEVARAQQVLVGLAELDAQGDQGWAAWLDNYSQNRAVLDARVRARIAEQETARWQETDRERTETENATALLPRLQHHLGSQVETVLAQEQWKGVLGADQAQDLLRFLWDQADRLYYEAEDGDGSGLSPREIGFRPEVFESLVHRELTQAKKYRDDVAKLQEVAKRNAAVTQPPVPSPAPSGPTPVKRAKPKTPESYRDWKRTQDDEDWGALLDEE